MKTYLVGGAVRDSLLGREVDDFDYVVVGATPSEMLALGFEQVGASFPVFLHPDTGNEYALARTERKVGAGYHGFETQHSPDVTLEDDLARRDLTINSMASTHDGELIDPFNGLGDLKARILRHTSDAFAEDPLRVVRLARFVGKFRDVGKSGFSIAPETVELAKSMVKDGKLNELPFERFGAEVRKVMETCSPEGCAAFFRTLHMLKCDKYVDFFRGVDLESAASIAARIQKSVVDSVSSALLGATAFATPKQAESIGGTLARDVHVVLKSIDSQFHPTVELMYETLSRSGAWRNSSVFSMTLTAMQVSDRFYAFPWTLLVQAEAVTTPLGSLGAELASAGVGGADIGQAIYQARLSELRKLDLE